MLEIPFIHPCQNQEELEVLSGAWGALILGKYLNFRVCETKVSGNEMPLRTILERKASFDFMKSRMPRPPCLLGLQILS